MKKIIISVAVAAMALSTTASALEDIKVSGQAKVWYETDNNEGKGKGDIFSKYDASAEVVFKLGMTGKQGDVSFGAEVTQGSTMGLENQLVTAARTGAANGDMFVSKAYIVAPVAPDTIVKLGRQELNTPFAFTEKWNAMQNNFDAAVIVNSSVSNLTLIAAYVGQTNTDIGSGTPSWKAQPNYSQLHGGAIAAGALFKNDMFAVNGWAYTVRDLMASGVTYNTPNAGLGVHAEAFWADAAVKVAGANIKGYVATMIPSGSGMDSTTGFAAAADYTIAGWKLFAAGAFVGEGMLPLGNVATNFKKTKLPTAGVYTDGLFVAQPESTSFKIKASGKLGTTGLALQAVNNTNDNDIVDDTKDTTEIDLIISQKVGAFNLKGILMHRMFENDALEDAAGGQHVRVIASVNF